MLLGTIGASLLGNLLARKAIVKAGSENKRELALEHNEIFNAASSINKF